MTGLMTAYFPSDTPLSKVISDTNQMIDIIADEMATNDWNGVTVSYNNEPIESSGAKEVEEESGGFPAGAIVGIVLAGITALAALVALVVFFIKNRREKDQQRMQARIIPFGDDSRRSQSFSDDDSDSDSSSEDDMSGVNSGPSAVSGGEYSYPTTMARANPSDVEQDDSSSSGTSSDDEDSGEYEIEDHETSVENLKTSASSDEAPPVYEQDDMGDFSQDQREYQDHDQYREQIAEDQNDFDMQVQYHDDQMQYGQMRGGDDRSNGSGGSMGSMNSADPPGEYCTDILFE